MKLLTSFIIAGAVGSALSGTTALANHRDWPDPRPDGTSRYVIVPPAQGNVVGYVTASPAYYYEPAPRYYYSEPAPRYHYYYEPAPAVAYYYDDLSAFPPSNSRD
jgi:hypothetical protein